MEGLRSSTAARLGEDVAPVVAAPGNTDKATYLDISMADHNSVGEQMPAGDTQVKAVDTREGKSSPNISLQDRLFTKCDLSSCLLVLNED